jgi:zinc transport system substrate-binding protein
MPCHWSPRLRALACLGWAALLAACTSPTRPEAGGRQRLAVVTTVLPITLLTRAVAGDCAEVSALVPPASNPHDFQARPTQLLALRQARVLVSNGLGLDDFLDKLVRAADNPQLRRINSSQGVATIAAAPADDAPHSSTHDHSGHDHGPVNPHIWLDPLRAAQQVATIRDGLIAADPACATTYRRNASRTTERLQRLHTAIATKLQPYRGRSFVAFHDVAPYFAQRYGLRGTFLVDLPTSNPSPRDLQRVAREVQRSQLRALLSEPQAGSRSFNALARDLGVPVRLFDPLETASEAAARNPDTYFTVMERNAAVLAETFAQGLQTRQ